MLSMNTDSDMWGWCADSDFGSECVGRVLGGKECNTSSECDWVDTAISCIDGICQCESGFRMNTEGLCVPETYTHALNIEQVLLCFAIVSLVIALSVVLYSVIDVYPRRDSAEYLQDTPRLSFHDRYHTDQFKRFNEEMDEVLSTSLRESDIRQRQKIEKRRKAKPTGQISGIESTRL